MFYPEHNFVVFINDVGEKDIYMLKKMKVFSVKFVCEMELAKFDYNQTDIRRD